MLTSVSLLLCLMFSDASHSQAAQHSDGKRLLEINQAHDQALFAPSAPYLVDEMTAPDFLKRFAREECQIEGRAPAASLDPSVLSDCDRRLKKALMTRLSERYFAVDRKAIEARCKAEELACMDPHVLELWIRQSHNSEIELSRKEKLARLKASPP